MKKQERKVILVGIAVVVVVLLILVMIKGASKEKKTNSETQNIHIEENEEKYAINLVDGTKINSGNEFNQTKRYKDIEISNIQFTYKDGKSVLLANVKNVGNISHKSEIVKMTILGENNQVIKQLEPVIPKIEVGETKQINVIISGTDSVNAKDFKIEAK